MIRTHIVSGRGVCLFVCLSVCLSALQTSISVYLQQIHFLKCILPLGLSTLRIQWAHPFYPQIPGSWWNRYLDIDILSVTPFIIHHNSVPSRCMAMELDPTPRLSYLRNQIVSSVLISVAGMMRYRYHEFDILAYIIRWQCWINKSELYT